MSDWVCLFAWVCVCLLGCVSCVNLFCLLAFLLVYDVFDTFLRRSFFLSFLLACFFFLACLSYLISAVLCLELTHVRNDLPIATIVLLTYCSRARTFFLDYISFLCAVFLVSV